MSETTRMHPEDAARAQATVLAHQRFAYLDDGDRRQALEQVFYEGYMACWRGVHA